MKDIGVVEGSGQPDTVISHGICLSCADKLKFPHEVSLKQFIDSIPIPLFVVDDDVVVQTVNAKACEFLGKEASALQGLRGGNVLECAYSRRPEGCGKTIHCSGCAIRRAVIRTFETGEPQSMVPATLHHTDLDDPSAIALRITTVKVDGTVFLRVDTIG
jgi:PAS domain-containing protein